MSRKPIRLTRRGDIFYWGIRGFIVRKFGSIALVMSLVHLIEDAILVGLGRYTEINFFISFLFKLLHFLEGLIFDINKASFTYMLPSPLTKV